MTESPFLLATGGPALPDEVAGRPGKPSHPAEERLRMLLLAGLDGDAVAYRQFLAELSGRLRAFLRKQIGRCLSDTRITAGDERDTLC